MDDHKHGRGTENGQSGSTAYETRDIKVRPLAAFVAGLTVVGIFVYLVVFLLLRLFGGEAAREDAQLAPSSMAKPAAVGEERLPPEPRIQANPEADMAALRLQEDAILTTYGWVDRAAGVARIPIDVAMKQVIEEGLPVREPDSAPPAAGTPAPVTSPQGGTKKATK